MTYRDLHIDTYSQHSLQLNKVYRVNTQWNLTYTDVAIEIGTVSHPAKTNILIQGESLDSILQATSLSSQPVLEIQGDSQFIIISSLTIEEATSASGIEVLPNARNITIQGNRIRNNDHEGIYAPDSLNISDIMVENNIISGNRAKGIRIGTIQRLSITNNTIYSNNQDGITCGACTLSIISLQIME